MKNIKINTLRYENFKGQTRNLEFGNCTEIHGANGTGKTTMFDAVTWLLFGKDSEDRKDFGIKPYDGNGDEIHEKDVVVLSQLIVDDEIVTLKRTLREKWVKPHGQLEKEFKGNETLFEINDAPVQLKQYNEYINSLCSEGLFKMITNPIYFSSLKWSDRRAQLLSMVDVSDEDILEDERFSFVADEIRKKDMATIKAEISAKKKLIKDKLTGIAPRIQENQLKISDIDMSDIETEISNVKIEIEAIDNDLLDESKRTIELQNQKVQLSTAISDLQIKRNNLRAELELDFNKKGNELKHKKSMLEQAIELKQQAIDSAKKQILISDDFNADLDAKKAKLIENWKSINSTKADLESINHICPTCNREYEQDKIEENNASYISNFNDIKRAKLSEIEIEGNRLKSIIEENLKQSIKVKEQINELQSQIETMMVELKSIPDVSENPIPSFASVLMSNEQIKDLDAKIADYTAKLGSIYISTNSVLSDKKKALQIKLEELQKSTSQITINKECAERISVIKAEEKDLNQQLANLEKKEFGIQSFFRTKIERVNELVNFIFSITKWKMFEEQVNGEINECCEAMYNGVRYSDLNTAMKINIGLDIIKTLQNFNKISAPIFIDNNESVSDLIEMDCQLIGLFVDENAKELTIINK